MRSTLKCPACQQPLAKEEIPAKSKSTPRPYIQLWCANPRCSSDAAQNDGGSAENERQAYLALLATVDNETETQCDEVTQADKNAWAVAERKNDQRGCL